MAGDLCTKLTAAREAESAALCRNDARRGPAYVGGWQNKNGEILTIAIPADERGMQEAGEGSRSTIAPARNPEEGWDGEGRRRSDARRAGKPTRFSSATVRATLRCRTGATAAPERAAAAAGAIALDRGAGRAFAAGADRGTIFRRGLIVHRLPELLPVVNLTGVAPPVRAREPGSCVDGAAQHSGLTRR
jgi:hypothetical protein